MYFHASFSAQPRATGRHAAADTLAQAARPRRCRWIKRGKALLAPLALCAFLFGAGPAAGADAAYPAKPITLVAPFTAGAAPDGLVRELAQGLTSATGQPVIVKNSAGASSSIAADFVARAPADGYTLLVTGNVAIAGNPHMFKHLSYDPATDLAPITAIARGPMVLYVSTERVPATNMQELIEYARKQPLPLQFAYTSITSRLPAELLREKAGIALEGVPYKSGAQALPDLVAGRVDMLFTDYGAWVYVDEGKLRPLAVTDSKRSARSPELPTMQETGLEGVQIAYWIAAYAPAGTPPAIIDKLNSLFAQASKNPGVAKAHTTNGTEEFLTTPQELAAFQTAETEEWGKIIRRAGIEPQ